MSNWVGYAISVNCGEPLGCYQGTILEADGSTITLTKAFRNGFPYPKSQVTLNAADIKDLKIIESRPEPAEQTHSTVAVTKGLKKAQRATVCENLQANPTSSGNQSSAAGGSGAASSAAAPPARPRAAPARSKPIDIQRAARSASLAGSYGNASSTPKGRGPANVYEKARRRNEACFGDLADAELDDDFDFEGNLALFNKRALWEELRNSHKPDVVRQADHLGKFRHDENVLGPAPAPRRAIRLPEPAPALLVTDEGLGVPAAPARLRAALWRALARRGLRDQADTLLARAAADVALRLAGGGRRLDPRNAHQAPTVVALAGPHAAGAAGLAAARLLASHGARAAALLAAPAPPDCAALRRELAALAPSGVALAAEPGALPGADVVLLALSDPAQEPAGELGAALEWAARARGAVLALEPPSAGWAGVSCRAAVLGGLPAALAPELGLQYLADVCVPQAVFAELGIQYRPPFGASPVLALHPATD
ncbi:enhancer of mRNA-decapping protein 3 [Helicoverpa zea]|uniref:enhancer of mRNA-decapping protein 3 n=1 Tax=Helicoverpa zea TaxID=7113 RepID=UPI001F567E33|nr:enhancer of mRNA-decapping protein 3 [Helicoverpa zea]